MASVNISQMEQLRFPDVIGDDFGNNSFHHFDKVLLPQAAFAPNKTGTATHRHCKERGRRKEGRCSF